MFVCVCHLTSPEVVCKPVMIDNFINSLLSQIRDVMDATYASSIVDNVVELASRFGK